MKTANIDVDALQMQIVRLVAGINDKGYLLSIRELLSTKSQIGDNVAVELTDEERSALMEGLKDVEVGDVVAHEEVQAKMRSKLGRK